MTSKYLWNNSDEVSTFEHTVSKFMNNEVDAERFMAFRLQHGIYGQRQDGVHMVRVKIPGGKLYAEQLPALSRILSEYSDASHASITTRQDIQFHFIKLANTPAVLKTLDDANLTSREACGNTVRNITACTLSGVCPKQYTDITPYAEAVAQHFLRHPLTQHLPRKFKMSFSACPDDCAMGLMHDVGVVATKQNDAFGFKLLAAGGLGHKPKPATVVCDFLSTEELIPAIEALITLHNRHSDRKRRAKARIKFLIEKFGVDNFIEKFNDEFQRTKLAVIDNKTQKTSWTDQKNSQIVFSDGIPRTITTQQQTGFNIIPLHLSLGQISADQLSGLHNIMQTFGLNELRTTSDQNLVLINVKEEDTPKVCDQLKRINLNTPKPGDSIIACPGTSTCRLGITSSRTIASELSNHADLRIRVSGCHNSCGQHHVADIGLHGEGKRIQGKLIPSYVLHLGGQGTTGGNIARKGPTVPTLRAKEAVERITKCFIEEKNEDNFHTWVQNKADEYFDDMLADLTHIEADVITDLAKDVGEEKSFRVLQLGGGECAGAAQDHVASNFSEALHERNYCSAFFLQHKHSEALECAKQTLMLTASSVLFLAGAKAKETLAETINAFGKILSHQPELITALRELDTQITSLEQQMNADAFQHMTNALDQWLTDSALACQAMDEQLNLATPEMQNEQNDNEEDIIELDLSTYECPLHYVKARNELRKMASKQKVKLILEDDEARRQVATSLKKEGHDILEHEPAGEFVALYVQRKE